jgi:hypothetical protein
VAGAGAPARQPTARAHLSLRRPFATASPFELTLEVDSSVTFCSSALHTLLLLEHRRSRLDFAVNFEASALAPGDALSAVRRPPKQVGDLLPHNFAMLLRKGAGLDALLGRWRAALERLHDDQLALRATLLALQRAGYRARPRTGCLLGGAACGTAVRVWRLREALLGFKSADVNPE